MKKFLFVFFLLIPGFLFFSSRSQAVAACDRNPPKVAIVPESRNRNGAPGDQVQYTIKITNKDQGSTCQNVNFTLMKEQLPNSNWTGSFSDNTLTIAKQRTKSTTFRLKSPNGATNGKKTITLAVKPEGRAKKSFTIYYTVLRSSPSTSVTPSPTRQPQPSTCQRVTPEMNITADKTYVRPGGGDITYTVKVKNVDQGPCSDRNMTLTRDLHNANWRGVWDPNNDLPNFAKGQTRTKKLKVTSPSGAGIGTYKVKVNLKNSDGRVVLTKNVDFIISTTPPTPTPSPSVSLTPTPTGGSNTLNITIGADGLGTTRRIPLGGNKNPDPDFTNLDIFLYSTSDNQRSYDTNTTFNYDPKKEKLVGTVSVASDLRGTFNLYAIGPQYTLARFPNSITLEGRDKNITSENFILIAGDVNKEGESNNNININDYNVILSCSIYSQNSSACDRNENYKEYSDLNYDGIVNEDDFTLWLKEVANQEGVSFPDE